jgi:PAS domain S-box-containing protein
MNTNGIHISEWVASLDIRKPFYLAIMDEKGFLTFTNSRFYTEFLSDREFSIHTNFFELVPQSDQASFKEILAASALQEDPITTEIRINNGLCRWVKWEVSCISSTGQRTKYLLLGYDIADEVQIKRTEEILGLNYEGIEAQARAVLFSTFMNHTPYFTWIVDCEGNLVFANKALLASFHTDESIFGKKLADILPGPIAGMIHEKHMALRQSSEDRSIIKCLMADGIEHVYNVIVFKVGDSSSDALIGGGALDISEAYQARQEEKRVTERLRQVEAQLAEQRLAEQKGIAEAIIKAQEDERTRIGHELHDNVNQILASGQLYLSLLKQDIDDFQEIKDKTMEILQLAIEEVRVLSKAMVLPDLKKGGLVASIDDLVHDLRFGNLFGVDFSHCAASDLEEMEQSKKLTLFRIVQEQTKNILKYSNAKKVEISLNKRSNWVRLEIKDDGIGFDPDNTRRGLGLSNIYERTRLYDGRIRLNTAPGKGCSIIVSIPLSTGNQSN